MNDPFFDARAAEMRDLVIEKAGDDAKELFMAVVCNACGRTMIAPSLEQLKPLVTDWTLSPTLGGLDYCPDCAGRN